MEEISTSFCFICLLHLANEQGLKLESARDSVAVVADEGVEDQDKVLPVDKKIGNLWDLKVRVQMVSPLISTTYFLTLQVYRDPDATRAA